ncbi:DUF1361 domain-containing protein [Clostridium hydrogeniformans]|uniref:DUF1361 domain-containing protein n=1 Tax=Clostridium hydrogeniformans TaxID=349933 RepID=UPI000487075F|nr:DUF1361 domain-containing protein [Clostridium hydrogeniformans]
MNILRNFKVRYKERPNIYAFRVLFWLYILITFLFVERFNFMILNLALAYIPLEISVVIDNTDYKEGRINKMKYWMLLLLWLFFYPNSPYLITDFFHLAKLNYMDTVIRSRFTTNPYVWKHFAYMATGVILGIGMGLLSLKIIYRSFIDSIKKVNSVIFVTTISFLSSYAIYVGRFLRLHSLDLIIAPLITLERILSVFSLKFFYFIIYMTIVQIIIYIVWKLIKD